jgi:hypothetical protein
MDNSTTPPEAEYDRSAAPVYILGPSHTPADRLSTKVREGSMTKGDFMIIIRCADQLAAWLPTTR